MTDAKVPLTAKIEPLTLLATVDGRQRIGSGRDG